MAGREEQGRKERIRDGGFQPGHFRQAGHSPLRNTTTLCGCGNEWCWEIKTALFGKCWGYCEIPRGGGWQTWETCGWSSGKAGWACESTLGGQELSENGSWASGRYQYLRGMLGRVSARELEPRVLAQESEEVTSLSLPMGGPGLKGPWDQSHGPCLPKHSWGPDTPSTFLSFLPIFHMLGIWKHFRAGHTFEGRRALSHLWRIPVAPSMLLVARQMHNNKQSWKKLSHYLLRLIWLASPTLQWKLFITTTPCHTSTYITRLIYARGGSFQTGNVQNVNRWRSLWCPGPTDSRDALPTDLFSPSWEKTMRWQTGPLFSDKDKLLRLEESWWGLMLGQKLQRIQSPGSGKPAFIPGLQPHPCIVSPTLWGGLLTPNA